LELYGIQKWKLELNKNGRLPQGTSQKDEAFYEESSKAKDCYG